MQQTKQKTREIARIRLRENQDLVVSLVDDQKVDIRIFLNSKRYTGPTKRGIRFYLFDGIWERFLEAMEEVNKRYQKIA